MGEGSDPVSDLVSGYKKKIKKVCCCGFWWVFIGVALFVSGVALLVEFGNWLTTDTDNDKKNYAIVGIAFLLISLVVMTIGIVCCVALYSMYKRLDKGSDFAKSQFKAPSYGPGDAPYPQQPRSAPCFRDHPGYQPLHNEGGAPANPQQQGPPANPSAPPVGFEGHGTDQSDVKIHVEEHTRF